LELAEGNLSFCIILHRSKTRVGIHF
jgi:hypothetical protein